MSELIVVIGLLAGIFLIVKGGDYFVDSASWIAEVSGIPKLIVGATVVSFATTLPELLVSSFAASEGKVDMCAGNAIGSVTANIGLIMAISLICIPSVVKRKDYAFKSILMITAASILVIFGFMYGSVTSLASIFLFFIFALAMYDNITCAIDSMKSNSDENQKRVITGGKKEIAINIIKFFAGAVGIIVGADLLVDNGSEFAAMLGVPERIIAITLVAIGTSLPELVTTITAISKKEHSLSVGNIIGANIIDLSLILPVSSIVSGKALPLSEQMIKIDLPICLAVGCIALLPTLVTKKFSRIQGFLLITVYIGYIVYSCVL